MSDKKKNNKDIEPALELASFEPEIKDPMIETPLPATHYVDNEKLYQACLAYYNKAKAAAEAGLPKPKIPDYIGSCLLKIATKLSYSRKFVNYPFRDEMVLDGVENCCLYFHNFNPEKYHHPFNYFTTVVYYAFLRRIHREKKQMYIKHKAMFNMIDDGLADHMAHDADFAEINIDEKITNNDYMKTFVQTYERKAEEKKQKRADTAKTRKNREGVDQFFTESDASPPTLEDFDPDKYQDL